MPLDPVAATGVVRTRIAEPLGMTVEAAALGVVTITEVNMSRAIRAITVERGIDPRTFTLLAYGGGGGSFAAGTAEELGVPRVVIPRAPATFSAWGILASDHREDASVTRILPLDTESVAAIAGDLDTLGARVIGHLNARGFAADATTVTFRLELRFDGQEHTIAVPLDGVSASDPAGFVSEVRARFVAMHRRLYGHGGAESPIEVVTTRCRGVGSFPRPRWSAWTVEEPAPPRGERRVVLPTGVAADAPVYDRALLGRGQRIAAPAIIEEWASCIFVPPDWTASVDAIGNLVMEAV
jgi:N-methylhydantoinase A